MATSKPESSYPRQRPSQTSIKSTNQPSPWLRMLATASFALLINMLSNLNALAPHLINELGFNQRQMALLFSIYYYLNTASVLIASLIITKFSVRKLLLLSFSLANFSTLILANSSTLGPMLFARLILGIVASFSMLSCIQVIPLWFRASQILLVTGLINTYASLGSLLGQLPLTLVITHLGWRGGCWLNLGVGLLLQLFCFRYTHDPSPYAASLTPDSAAKLTDRPLALLATLRTTVLERQNWLLGLYLSLIGLPGIFYGATRGIEYLTSAKSFSLQQSAIIITMTLMGSTMGPLLFSKLATLVPKSEKRILLTTTTMLILVIITIHWYAPSSMACHIPIFLILGLLLSSPSLLYNLILKYPSGHTSIALGFISTLSALAGVYIHGLGNLALYLSNQFKLDLYTAAHCLLVIATTLGLLFLNRCDDQRYSTPL